MIFTQLLLSLGAAVATAFQPASAPARGDPPTFTLAGHAAAVTALAFAPDGRTLLAGCGDGSVTAWDLPKRQKTWAVAAHTGRVYTVSYTPKGERFATGGEDEMACLWDAGGHKLAAFENVDRVYAAEFSPDGHVLATGCKDAALRIWAIGDRGTEPPTKPATTIEGFDDQVRGLAYFPDGKTLTSLARDGTVKFWSTGTWQAEPRSLHGHTDRTYGLALAPDAKTLATAGKDRRLILWDVVKREKRWELSDHASRIEAICFSPDGALLASVDDGGTLLVRNSGTGKPTHTFDAGIKASSLRFSPDGRMLAAAGEDKIVRIWAIGVQP